MDLTATQEKPQVLYSTIQSLEVTLHFLYIFYRGVLELSPPLLFLLAIIVSVGLAIGRIEKWTVLDSLYFAFITATTVGYGDIRPLRGRSKVGAILIALTGMVLTAIVVAISLHALDDALTTKYARSPSASVIPSAPPSASAESMV